MSSKTRPIFCPSFSSPDRPPNLVFPAPSIGNVMQETLVDGTTVLRVSGPSFFGLLLRDDSHELETTEDGVRCYPPREIRLED